MHDIVAQIAPSYVMLVTIMQGRSQKFAMGGIKEFFWGYKTVE